MAVNKETVILRKLDDSSNPTDTIAVWDHDATEIGTFDIGSAETPQYYGEQWIITVDTAAGNYYFYQRNENTYTKSAFTLIYSNDADKSEMITQYNEYDEYILYRTVDKTADPQAYSYLNHGLDSSGLETVSVSLSVSTERLAGIHWRDRVLMVNHDATSDEIKTFYSTWEDQATKEWSQTVVSDDVDNFNIALVDVGARTWIVQNTGVAGDAKTYYDLRSWEDGASSLKIANDATLGDINSFNIAYENEYTVVQYIDENNQYTVVKQTF